MNNQNQENQEIQKKSVTPVAAANVTDMENFITKFTDQIDHYLQNQIKMVMQKYTINQHDADKGSQLLFKHLPLTRMGEISNLSDCIDGHLGCLYDYDFDKFQRYFPKIVEYVNQGKIAFGVETCCDSSSEIYTDLEVFLDDLESYLEDFA